VHTVESGVAPRAETEPALAAWNALLAWARGRGHLEASSVRRELWVAVCQWGLEARGRGGGQEGAFAVRALMSAIDRLGCTDLVNGDAWPCVPFVPCDGIGCAVRCLHAPMFAPRPQHRFLISGRGNQWYVLCTRGHGRARPKALP
jgi:hypothetical protein